MKHKQPMPLLDDELLARFREVGGQEQNKDPLVIARYFWPYGSGIWYATEYDPERKMFFGFVSIFGDHCDEWGYFSLAELETPLPIKISVNNETVEAEGYIERDLLFAEKPISRALQADGLQPCY